MSIFLLPKSFCQQIDSILRSFWWGFKEDKKYNYFIPLAWNRICTPKYMGGLWIRFMASQNKALLAKFGMEIVERGGSSLSKCPQE
jgi:hypothetical protein